MCKKTAAWHGLFCGKAVADTHTPQELAVPPPKEPLASQATVTESSDHEDKAAGVVAARTAAGAETQAEAGGGGEEEVVEEENSRPGSGVDNSSPPSLALWFSTSGTEPGMPATSSGAASAGESQPMQQQRQQQQQEDEEIIPMPALFAARQRDRTRHGFMLHELLGLDHLHLGLYPGQLPQKGSSSWPPEPSLGPFFDPGLCCLDTSSEDPWPEACDITDLYESAPAAAIDRAAAASSSAAFPAVLPQLTALTVPGFLVPTQPQSHGQGW